MLVSAIAGKPKKMVYRATSDVLVMNAEKFGKWTRNNSSVDQTDYFIVGRNRERTRFWLKIKSVNIRDSGLYSFRVNDTVVKQWLLEVKGNSKGSLNIKVGQSVSQLTDIC